jgi:hypothetical protein
MVDGSVDMLGLRSHNSHLVLATGGGSQRVAVYRETAVVQDVIGAILSFIIPTVTAVVCTPIKNLLRFHFLTVQCCREYSLGRQSQIHAYRRAAMRINEVFEASHTMIAKTRIPLNAVSE